MTTKMMTSSLQTPTPTGTSAGIPVKRRSQSMSALKEDPRSPRKMGGIIVSFGEILSLSNRTMNLKILVNNNNNNKK